LKHSTALEVFYRPTNSMSPISVIKVFDEKILTQVQLKHQKGQ